jgi:2-polyprenyl-3-methyl-5-hydroxy-6-metoxy-1,4-benzoquinol methylase
MNCLLCNTTDISILKQYPRESLKKLWAHLYDIDKICKDEFVNLHICNNCGLEFFDPKHAGEDEFYSTLGKLDWYYNHPGKTEYDFVQKYFQDGIRVLDIGCGTGVLLSKTKANIDYTGLELSSGATQIANENGIKVLNETIQNHAETNVDKYDVVVSFQVLEHLTEVKSFIEAALKVLRKGGRFIVAMPNNESFISRIPNYTFNLPPHHVILWKRKQIEFIAKMFSLELENFHNEELQEVHLESAKNSARYWFVNSLRFKKNDKIDFSSEHLKTEKYVHRLNRIVPGKILDVVLKSKFKDGQSMIAVFKKK